MTRERYLELLAAGPEITAEDYERLKNFTPRRKALSVAVELALLNYDFRVPKVRKG